MEETAESKAIIVSAEMQAAATMAATVFVSQGKMGADEVVDLYNYIRGKIQTRP